MMRSTKNIHEIRWEVIDPLKGRMAITRIPVVFLWNACNALLPFTKSAQKITWQLSKTMFTLNFVGDRRRSRRHNSISQIDVSYITKGSHLAPPGAQSRDGLHKVASAPNVGTAVKVEPPASPVKTSASTTPSSSTESEIDEKERSRLARKYVVHTHTQIIIVIASSLFVPFLWSQALENPTELNCLCSWSCQMVLHQYIKAVSKASLA